MVAHIQIAVKDINWRLLRLQKLAILESIWRQELNNTRLVNALEGMISLIDAIQDAAVDDGIATELEVFGRLED